MENIDHQNKNHIKETSNYDSINNMNETQNSIIVKDMKTKDKFQSSQDSIINPKNKKKFNQTFFADNKIVNKKNQGNLI